MSSGSGSGSKIGTKPVGHNLRIALKAINEYFQIYLSMQSGLLRSCS